MSENLSQEELIKMLVASQQSGENKNTLKLDTRTVIMGLIGAIIILTQFAVSIGQWSIQEKLKESEGNSQRLSQLERLVPVIDQLTVEVKGLKEDSKQSITGLEFAEKTRPILDSLARIEQTIKTNEDSKDSENREHKEALKEFDKRIDVLEKEVDILERTRK